MSVWPPPAIPDSSLLIEDLRLSLEEIGPLFSRAVAGDDRVDAFLLAAGASQLLRDQLEDDPGRLLRATSMLEQSRRAAPRAATSGASMASRALNRARGELPNRRRLAMVCSELDRAIDGLAASVYTGTKPRADDEAAARALADAVLCGAGSPGGGVRQPSCFRSFDQHPNDVRELARRVLTRRPYGPEGYVVVGVRTSGSYLAPLLSAALQLEGGGGAPWVTLRPGHPPAPAERARLTACLRAGAQALLIDDPPGTGGSLARVDRQLQLLGGAQDRITLVLALLERGSLPPSLGHLDTVLLEWPDWDIHRRLAPDAVRSLLEHVMGGRTRVLDLQAFALSGGASNRGHVQVGYRARVESDAPGKAAEISLVAEGSGLGYFGRHAVALAGALPGLIPDVLGFDDGVTLREWLADEARVVLDSDERVRRAVHYVTQRRAALPAHKDAAGAMAGQQPAWEIASRLLAGPYGPAGLAVRTLGLDAAIRAMLSPRSPSVVDGQTGGRAWFEDEGAFVKVNFADRAFSNLDLACYDAAYDVAGLALGTSTRELAEVARLEFEASTGVVVDHERWLLYRLVHLWDLHRLGHLSADAAELAMARVWQDWSAARLLCTTLDDVEGPWCAVDIDGVLETSRLGAPVLSPSAANGLRTLHSHGHRVVIATGRGSVEVQDRCASYGLLGGVAEYGCVLVVASSGVVRDLVNDDERAALAEVRSHLAGHEGIQFSGSYRAAVRAFRLDDSGRRVGLEPAMVAAALLAAPDVVIAHQGVAQTDFVPAGIDKATGLRALLGILGAPGEDLDAAVGDSEPDLGMLRLASRGFVPAHARHLAGPSIRAQRRPFQRGFEEAADQIVGHEPASCPRCEHRAGQSDGAALISALLSGLEGGRDRGAALVPEILRRARRVITRSRLARA